jgi:hypothetical protein
LSKKRVSRCAGRELFEKGRADLKEEEDDEAAGTVDFSQYAREPRVEAEDESLVVLSDSD